MRRSGPRECPRRRRRPVGACDGDLTVGEIASALATLLEVPADDVAAELLPAVRELAVDGFLRLE
ncbi:hypothetical protein [Georgenia sp. SUBG003]|uniref:hypothetical protein n=1 Tax=Georgenia sp. SUBG003 TaxID=1497974 RepID=UPI003AB51DDE